MHCVNVAGQLHGGSSHTMSTDPIPSDEIEPTFEASPDPTPEPTSESPSKPSSDRASEPTSDPVPQRRRPPRSLLSYVVTHNPFYALATALVFYGLRVSFPPGESPHYSALLAACLATYVAMLVGAAVFLRRINALWEDLRMVALLVVVMLPAISITFDEHLVKYPASGLLYGLGGALFAGIVSEVLLFGLRVRLPVGYRIPYHLLTATFFLYPVLVRRFADSAGDPQLHWTMFGFAPLVCAILLSCLPAVARGHAYVSQNGTPWGWPLYPTTIFALLTVCAAGRAWYLCRSFHFVGDQQGIFGPYFLIPLVFAAAAWCAVGGVKSGNRTAQIAALLLPILSIGLSSVGSSSDYIFWDFLARYQRVFKTLPPLSTIYLATAFYVALWACRVKSSAVLTFCLLLWASVIGPDSTGATDFRPLDGYPIAAAAVLSSIRAVHRRDSFWWACVWGSWTLLSVIVSRKFPGAPVAFIGFHTALVLAVAAAIGLGRERGRPFGLLAALLIAVAGLHALKRSEPILFNGLPTAVANWYPPLAAVLAFSYAALFRNEPMAMAATVVALTTIAKWTIHGYMLIRPNVRGLDFIVAGLGCLAVALRISYLKARRQRKATAETG
jgi:hypothetical protein